MTTMWIFFALIVGIMLLGYVMSELMANAPLEEEVAVEIDLTSPEDVAEKNEVVEQLLAKGYWIVEKYNPDKNHELFVLRGLKYDNKPNNNNDVERMQD